MATARSLSKRSARPSEDAASAPGFAVRRIAADIVEGVLRRRRPLDELLERTDGLAAFEERDRALVRALVGIVLRRLGTLRHLLAGLLGRGLPPQAPRVETALLLGAAQILFLGVPDHAAVDLSVRLAQTDRPAARYAGLVNAVLRRLAREGREQLATLDIPVLDTPGWLMARWVAAYGADTAHAIAAANGFESALDVTVKADAEEWAAKLGGRVLPTGSVRAVVHGPITTLPGFAEGAWWVQDAAAALPVKLLTDIRGKRIADLCAAPGGKTAQLAATGAIVTAVDRAPVRLERLRENLGRLSLTADIVCADVTEWTAEPFDAVLLDAPCSATGTIRRHPDLPWLKNESDVAKLSALQHRLIDRAAVLTKPGGTLIYCTCSLEREENEAVVAAFLERTPSVNRSIIRAAELSGHEEFINAEGELRALPCHLPDADSRLAGLDGFYSVRLVKN
jgi:16S rRNA (cytosine967-C5)-methyltransferase